MGSWTVLSVSESHYSPLHLYISHEISFEGVHICTIARPGIQLLVALLQKEFC